MTVAGLQPENTYDFYLAAGNPAGFGKSIKFKVRTPRIAPTLPPMPPPVKTDPPPQTQPEPDLTNSSHLGAKQPKPENIPVYKSSESPDRPLPMALILGGSCAIIFLMLLLFIIILVVRRKKKRNDHPYGVKSVVKSHSQEMELSLRRKNSPLPNIPPGTPKMGERQTAVMEARLNGHMNGHMNGHAIHAHTSPRPSRDREDRPVSTDIQLDVVKSNTAARAAWDFMLQHKDLDTSDDEVRDSDGDIPLPPPPPELSSPQYILGPGSNTLPANIAKYRHGQRRHDYQDIFDGYHSSENIDSDIEEVTDDMRLQLPSYSDLNLAGL